MPPKKKAKTDTAGPTWQYVGDDHKWVEFVAEDSKLIETNYRATKGDKFTTTDLSFNKGFGTKYTFDFNAMTQTNDETKRSRHICRLAPRDEFQWEWEDDMKLMVQFFDEDAATIEVLYQQSKEGDKVTTTKLSWNKGYDAPYTFTFQRKEGSVTGTQVNEQSKTARNIRRIQKSAPWDVTKFGIAALMEDTKKKTTASAEANDDDDTSSKKSAPPALASLGSGSDAPPYWEGVTTIDTALLGSFDQYNVKLTSDEGKRVIDMFSAVEAPKGAKVEKITRIQNTLLWSFFALQRQSILSRPGNEDATKSEGVAFFGERSRANMNTLLKYGFDTRVAEDGSLGKGLYFGLSSKYCDNGRCLVNSDASKEVFLCRVVHGQVAKGSSGLRRPPPKDPKKPTMDLYDSCVDDEDPKKVSVRVLFNNNQAYPEYIIKYKK